MMHIPFVEQLVTALAPEPSVGPAEILTTFFAPNPVRVIRGLVLQTWPRGCPNQAKRVYGFALHLGLAVTGLKPHVEMQG